VLNRSRTGLDRRTVPFVLPVLTLEEPRTGLGLNAALAPRMRLHGRHINRTATLMLQSTCRLATQSSRAAQIEVELTPEHGLRMAYSTRY
jgi:hypothetical protein